MELNIWWLFFAMAAGTGFFWGTSMIFGHSKQRPGISALGLVMLTFSLTLFHYVLVWSESFRDFPHLAGLWQASSYFYGPLLLIFFSGKQKIPAKIIALHFIPGFLLFVAWLPFACLPAAEKLKWLGEMYPYDTALLLHRSLLYLLYPLAMVGVQLIYGLYFMWRSHTQQNGDRKLKQLVAILFLIFIAAQVSYFISVKLPGFKIEWDYMISLAMTFCIFRIASLTLHRPDYFFISRKRSPLEGKYNTSPLNHRQSQHIADILKTHVESERSFLDPDLRLPLLAKALELTPHQVSQAINENFNRSFSEWINQYRIAYACELLSAGDISAKEAGYQSGFNSLSTFYQVFKKEKGMSPAKYSKLQSVG